MFFTVVPLLLLSLASGINLLFSSTFHLAWYFFSRTMFSFPLDVMHASHWFLLIFFLCVMFRWGLVFMFCCVGFDESSGKGWDWHGVIHVLFFSRVFLGWVACLVCPPPSPCCKCLSAPLHSAGLLFWTMVERLGSLHHFASGFLVKGVAPLGVYFIFFCCWFN